MQTKIIGSGAYIPKVVVPNEAFLGHTFFKPTGELIQKDTNEIIRKLADISEIEERRYASEGIDNATMGYHASRQALDQSGIDKESLDQIIFAHNFGNVGASQPHGDLLPNLAARVKHKLGITNNRCVAYDILFGCPGWLQGIIQGHLYIKAGAAKRVLVIGSELMSRTVDQHDLDSMLFSDGAGATIIEGVESANSSGILSHVTVSDCGEEVGYLYSGASNNPVSRQPFCTPKMNGKNVYKYSLQKVPAAIKYCLGEAGIPLKEVSKILIHQANGKMIKQIVQKLYDEEGLGKVPESVMPLTVSKLGNNSVATIPILLHMVRNGELDGVNLHEGEVVVMASVGAGMHANCVVYRV